MKKGVLVLLAALAGCAHSEEKSDSVDWQGEWGQWRVEQVDGQPVARGAHLKIQNCERDGEAKTCRAFLISEDGSGKRCSGRADLTFSSGILGAGNDQQALVQMMSADGTPADCFFDSKLDLSSSPPRISLQQGGAECADLCTNGTQFETNFPLRSRKLYGEPAHDHSCYLDSSPVMQTWCTHPGITQKEREWNRIRDSFMGRLGTPVIPTEEHERWRTAVLKSCAPAPDIARCIEKKYEVEIRKLRAAGHAAVKARQALQVELARPGDPVKAQTLMKEIEGVYRKPFMNTRADGSEYQAENTLEIVPHLENSLYFRLRLELYNGRECELYGLAHYKRSGDFIFHAAQSDNAEEPCMMSLRVGEDQVRLMDSQNSCKGTCGLRGSFRDLRFDRSAKRTIKFMDLLKESDEYRRSIGEIPSAQ